MRQPSKALFVALLLALASSAYALEGGAPIGKGDRLGRASVAVGAVVSVPGRLGVSYCSGALIAPDLVLTAAHCVRNPLAATVLFYDSSNKLGAERSALQVARYSVPGSDIPTRYARSLADVTLDTAVLRLAEPIWGRTPIPVASPGEAVRATLHVAGIGLSHRGAGTLRRARLTPLFATEHGLIVARAVGSQLCTGDSGGPVVSETRRGLRLFGVVSAVLSAEPPCGEVVLIAPASPAL